MFKIIAVSNWKLFQEYHKTENLKDYVNHLAGLKASLLKPDMLILREKNLAEPEYEHLLDMVKSTYPDTGMELMPHTYLTAANHLGIEQIHLPFSLLEQYKRQGMLDHMKKIGVSVHVPEEAVIAGRLGASYLMAGHIFATDCKKGLEPRGIDFLEDICKNTKLPVYAIGGIHSRNLEYIKKTGAAGACMMSEFLR